MKFCLGFASLCAFLPALALATPFEKHFGSYTVISGPDRDSGCPAQEARIYRRAEQGYDVIAFEALGHHSADGEMECNSRFGAALSVRGMPALHCNESEDFIQCVQGGHTFEASAATSADGTLTLGLVTKGPNSSNTTWVLKRK